MRSTSPLLVLTSAIAMALAAAAVGAQPAADDDAGTAMVWLFFGGLLAGVLAFVGVSHLRAKRRARGARGAAGHGARRTG